MAILFPARQERRLYGAGTLIEQERRIVVKVRVVGYRCSYCKKEFKTHLALLKHFDVKVSERPVDACEHCQRGPPVQRAAFCHVCAPVFEYITEDVRA